VTGAAAIVAGALVASAPPLYHAWLGHPEPVAALALRGLSLAGFAALAGGVSGAIARGVGRTSIELEWSGLALVLHAGLCVVLVPRLGMLGALVAIVIANVAAAQWFAWRLARAQAWPASWALLEPFFIPVLAIAAGFAAGTLASRAIAAPWLALLVAAAVGGAASLLVLLATRYLRWDELLRLARRGMAP
jgi:O-antigen/teichoic acid export membrane protein